MWLAGWRSDVFNPWICSLSRNAWLYQYYSIYINKVTLWVMRSLGKGLGKLAQDRPRSSSISSCSRTLGRVCSCQLQLRSTLLAPLAEHFPYRTPFPSPSPRDTPLYCCMRFLGNCFLLNGAPYRTGSSIYCRRLFFLN